jgi:hypothetical protein
VPPSSNGDAALKARLVAAYNNGDDLDKLAAAQGITRGKIYKLIRHEPGRITRAQRMDLCRRRKGIELAKLYNAGMSLRRIERRTDRSYGGVRNLLILVGVKMRPIGGAGIWATRAAELAAKEVPEAPVATTQQTPGTGP